MFLLILILTLATMAEQDCMKLCTKNKEKEMVRCAEEVCLLRSKGYNWREVPKGVTQLTSRMEQDDMINPCCPSGEEDLPSSEICQEYRTFVRQLGGNPVRVWIDFKVLKIYNISMAEDHYSAVVWLQMSWVDPKLEICHCGLQKERGQVMLGKGEKEKLWLPDMHILEAREFERMWGLARQREKVKVVEEEGGQPMVVYDVTFKVVLACHFNTSYFPLSKNKCNVRFGSYNKDRSKVVFEQKSRFISTKTNHPIFNLEMFPVQEKDKQVTRDYPNMGSNKLFLAYDGFQLIVREQMGSVEYQYVVTMLVLVSLGFLGIYFLSGLPSAIDRAGLFSMALLGSVLLLVEVTSNTPHGYEAGASPLIVFIKVSIATIVICFGCYVILVRLTSDGVITGSVQDKMELAVFLGILPIYVACVTWFGVKKSYESEEIVCHNLVH